MILHIIENQTFTNPFIKFMKENFNFEEHRFLIIGGASTSKFVLEREENIILGGENSSRLKKMTNWILVLYKELLNAEQVILHGFFQPFLVVFLFFNPLFLKKTKWVIWGGDLYFYKKPKHTFIKKLYEFMRAFCIKKFGGIVSLTEGDYQLAKEWYNTNAKEYFGMYINPVKKEYLDDIKIKEKKEIYIQIGNSADSSNNHIEIIDLLKKYKNENIKIYAPLSYGNKEYAFEVKKYGEKIFGDKFISMMEFLKPEEYSEYLGSIDVLVFNHKRQQGLGNIYALVYLGKKIFIRSDISSWNFFEDTLDIKLADTLNIDKIDFESLMSNNYVMHNKKRAEETFYSDKYISNLWEKVFRGE